ncbi:ABC transporter permease [Bergeriella denitrificans]|uniref:Putative transporter n=1 Tax=Bergeriella denitrificans TaxID=494 RepID=A0A378UJ42_BERDE|nr:iron ABC transporter permease [Bergeriella denitrificans]STZ77305.1 putative transporter [Bergeriella denitrificans]
MNIKASLPGLLAALLPLGFLAVMVVAPMTALALYDGGGMVWSVWGDDYMRGRIVWTLVQAAATCVLTLLLGVPAAWALARLDFFGRRRILRLLMLPFAMPTLVAGMGVLALFGADGFLWAGWQDTPYLLIYGNVFFNLPVLLRAAYQGFLSIPETRLQTAQTLGADARQRFWQIEWPALRPWLAGGACLVFLYCFSGFGLALLLGGNRYATAEVEIYRLIAYELDIAQASALVWLVLAVTAAAGLLYARLSRRTASARALPPPIPRPPQSAGERVLLVWTWAVLLVCCALPLAAVWVQALAAGRSWLVLLEADTLAAAWNTLRFSAMAVGLAVVLGIAYALAARRSAWIRALTFLPFMVSPVCIAFGILLLYPDWTASLPLLVATYALLAYPFVAKDILAAWDNLSENYAAAARSMGANRFQTACRVTAPLLMPALRRGTTLAAATCIGEFAATLFLSRPEWQTLTTLIYSHLGRAGADNYAKAMVLTAVLMGLAVAAFLLLDEKEDKKAV